jgi:hypothetical protein
MLWLIRANVGEEVGTSWKGESGGNKLGLGTSGSTSKPTKENKDRKQTNQNANNYCENISSLKRSNARREQDQNQR